MKKLEYNRQRAVEYAKEWAYKRNPLFYNFDSVGGDCTSFVSQCIYYANKIMNYNRLGWYYKNGYNKSASWSGVEYLYNFLTTNESVGPYGREVDINEIDIGDIIQLSFDGQKFTHSLIVVDTYNQNGYKRVFVATHTEDSYYRELLTYKFDKIRFIKIDAIRSW